MQVIYNYTYIAPLALLHQLLPAIGIILFLLVFGWFWWMCSSADSRVTKIVMRAIASPVLLLFFGAALLVGYDHAQDWWQIHQLVTGSELQIVEGEVTDYDHKLAWKANGARDDFRVDGVHFSYGSTDLTVPIGYRKNARDGGYIRGDGQYVRISYITLDTGRNVILRIEAPADN